MVEQHFHVMFRRGQISDPQRDRACRLGQGATYRQNVICLPSVSNAAFGGVHRLFWKSLEPQNPRKKEARLHPRIDLKADDVRPVVGSHVMSEHVFEMAPRAG